MVMIIPPRKRKDLLLLNKLMTVKEVKAIAVYKSACTKIYGSNSAKWWMAGPTKNPMENAKIARHTVLLSSELFLLLIL